MIKLILSVFFILALVSSFVLAQQSHPASEIEPGTFAIGDYRFPRSVYWTYDDLTNAAFLDADVGPGGNAYIVYNSMTGQFLIYTKNSTNANLGRISISSGNDVALVDIMSSDFIVDTNTLKVDSTNNRVGIGTLTPSSLLEVAGNVELTNLYDNDETNFFDGGCGDNSHVTSISSTGAISCAPDSGDISNVTAGAGLSGGGTSGAVSLKVIDCNAGEIIKSGGPGSWVCGSDNTGGSISPGTLVGQTLRWDGSNWVANSNLFNNGVNVGIGTTSPNTKLDVNGDLNISGNLYLPYYYRLYLGKDVYIYGNEIGPYIYTPNVFLVGDNFGVDGSTFFVKASNDRVGIGTNNPNYKLEVLGDIRTNQSLTIGDLTLAETSSGLLQIPGSLQIAANLGVSNIGYFGHVMIGTVNDMGAGTVNAEKLCINNVCQASWLNLNADYLDGQDSSYYLDTSSTAQTKSGSLTASKIFESCTGGASSARWTTNGNYHCYIRFDNFASSFYSARRACENLGGYLVIITSSDEQNFIVNNLLSGTSSPYWIGFSDARVEGQWEWITGEIGVVDDNAIYTNWIAAEPSSEDCAVIQPTASMKWNALPCSVNSNFYICEKNF
jgi:hypothetical protein